MLFLAFTFRIQQFKPKSAILAGKIEQFGEEIFPLTDLEINSIFLIIVFLSRCQVNPTTKPLTFRGVK